MGLYVGTSLMFLWLSFSDFILPVRVAFVTALFSLLGYTLIELVSAVRRPFSASRAFFSGSSFVVELGFTVYAYDAVSFWIRNVVPVYYMQPMPLEVQLFGTAGLMVTVAFFLYLQYYLFQKRRSSPVERFAIAASLVEYLIATPIFMLYNPNRALLNEGALFLSVTMLGWSFLYIYSWPRIVGRILQPRRRR
jgi:hypothetical protein